MARIYLASSWRNEEQPRLVVGLRAYGHEVYDFRHPEPGNEGFHWSEIDPSWRNWDAVAFRAALESPVALKGFGFDFAGMNWADTCVLALPSGKSAHLEAGYMAGQGKRVVTYLGTFDEPELMYLALGDTICVSFSELLDALPVATP